MPAELRTLPVRPDEADVGWVHEQYYARLVRFAARRFGASDAEDVAQETIARCVALWDRIDLDRDLWPWLVTVAERVGIDLARTRRRSMALGDEALERAAPAVADVADTVLAEEERRLLVSALDGLGANDRRILRLREVDGLSFEAIGEFLGVTANAARQQMFRARGRLARAYEGLGGRVGALVGWPALRLRQLAYRYGDALHRVASLLGSGGWLVVAGPVGGAVGAVVLGVGLPGSAPGGEPGRPATAAYASVRDADEVRRGAGAGGSDGVPGRASAPPQPPPRYAVDVAAGPASARSRARDPRRITDPGRTDETRVIVETPYGTLSVGTVGENSPGQSVVCSVPMVRCEPA